MLKSLRDFVKESYSEEIRNFSVDVVHVFLELGEVFASVEVVVEHVERLEVRTPVFGYLLRLHRVICDLSHSSLRL